jgi:electron transport complex protein RnfE
MNWNNLTKGFFKENPVFVLLLGCCPTLATTTSAINGLSMGLATTFVLILSNMCISLLKNFIPNKVHIPGYIVVIASFVTVELQKATTFDKMHLYFVDILSQRQGFVNSFLTS